MKKDFSFEKRKARSGFTLIEILIVIGIFGVVAALGTSMFFSLLKGAAKARVMTEVKQNGDHTLRVMERMIRNAQEITTDPDESGVFSAITTLNSDNDTTIFSCSDNNIASNSANLISNQLQVDNCSFTVTKGQPGLTADEVVISFTLRQTGSGGRHEEEASINFNSRVVLRNVVRE